MPIDRSPEALNSIVERVLKDEQQLRDGLEQVGYEGREIYDEIGKASEQVWEVAVSEIQKHDTDERLHAETSEFVNKSAGAMPVLADAEGNPWVTRLGMALSIGFLIVLAVLAYKFYQVGLALFSALATAEGWAWLGLMVGPLAAIGGAIAWLEKRDSRDQAARNQRLEALWYDWGAKKKALADESGLPSLEAALSAQKELIDKLLFERTKQQIISAINRRTVPSYALKLEIEKPRGFGEVFDRRFTVQTPARDRLQFMLQSMPGGSIGIAGSRGAGKTTLLRLFCGPKRVIETLNKKPVLGVLVSAPVAYQAREFILYLFSTACQNVIEAEGGKFVRPGLPADAPPTRLEDGRAFVALRPLPSLLMRFGILMMLLSVILAIFLVALQLSAPAISDNSPAAQRQETAVGPTGPTGLTDQKGQQDPKTTGAGGGPPPQSPVPVAKSTDVWLPLRLTGIMKVDPSPLLLWGASLLIVGLMLAEFLRLGVWRQLGLSLAQILHVATFGLPPYARLTRALVQSQRELAEKEIALRQPATVAPNPLPEPPPGSLWAHAEAWLKAIKFQQSYTSGWSGALKLPIGLEGGVNRAVTLAQNQLSLPEIGSFFTRFLEEASGKYQVIIGIDEMDKLASDELAQQFLNDIKSVFGVERCFYLISVSEHAMANFERRGLPFRDVFDSAFDDFVYVDYLSFAGAKLLLEQRIVGRPIPFFALSYCMSGGLARDLIRNFRGVLEAHEQDKAQAGLSAICGKVVEADLRGKLRATRTSAKKVKLEAEVDQFLETLQLLEAKVASDDFLVDKARELLAMAAPAPAKPRKRKSASTGTQPAAPGAEAASAGDKERAAKLEELQVLAEEIGTYVLYAVTLRQFFTDSLSQNALTNPPDDGTVDMMAKSRQMIGINPAITLRLLNAFRLAHGLAAVP